MDGILRGGGGELVLRKAMTKNAQGAASVRCGGDDQYTVHAEWLKTTVDVVGLTIRRESSDGTHGDAFFLRERTDISLSDFSAGLVVDHVRRSVAERLPPGNVPLDWRGQRERGAGQGIHGFACDSNVTKEIRVRSSSITRVIPRLCHDVKIPRKARVPGLESPRSMLEFCLDL